MGLEVGRCSVTVLVSYATSCGSTAEIVQWIAEELRDAGLTVDVRAAAEVRDVAGYAAIVVGVAMYAAGCCHGARQFAHRFAGRSPEQPVWLFSSGPLDSSADETDPPPVHHAAEAMRALHARGHITFGGRLSAEARGWLGFLARRMASEGHGGDFRNPQRVWAWARGIAAEITSAERGSVADPAAEPRQGTGRCCHARASRPRRTDPHPGTG
jgi:menaquinone-dependent protoporphyrinogen oxidase